MAHKRQLLKKEKKKDPIICIEKYTRFKVYKVTPLV